jgi:hypothetical protein
VPLGGEIHRRARDALEEFLNLCSATIPPPLRRRYVLELQPIAEGVLRIGRLAGAVHAEKQQELVEKCISMQAPAGLVWALGAVNRRL